MATKPYAKTEQVLTTLKPEDRDELDALALGHGVSRAEQVRRYVLEGMKRDREKRRVPSSKGRSDFEPNPDHTED